MNPDPDFWPIRIRKIRSGSGKKPGSETLQKSTGFCFGKGTVYLHNGC